MNDRYFERFVADHVGDGGVTLPGAFYDDMHALASQTRQRPRWLALIKEPPMRVSSRVAVGSPVLQTLTILAASLAIAVSLVGAGIAGQRLLAADDPIIVDQSGGGDFITITDAVDAAQDGAIIIIKPGRYPENVVVMDKDLTIRGDGDRDDIVIEAVSGNLPIDYAPASGEDAPDMPPVILADSPYAWAMLLADTDTLLSNLTVIGQQVGTAIPIIGPGSAPIIEGILVRVPGPASGHWLSVNWTTGTGGALRDSEVEGWLAIGPDADVVLESNVLPATCVVAWDTGANMVIKDNQIHGCPYEKGIDIAAGNSARIEHNDIWVEDLPADASADAYSGGRPAIEVAGPEGSVTIIDNEIHDSLFGVIVNSEFGPTMEIAANRIHDNGVGISGIDESSAVSGNSITGNVTGVEIAFGAEPTLDGNTISQNQIGLSVSAGSAPVLRGNTVCDNGTAVLSTAGVSIDLAGNETCEVEPSEAPE